MALQDSFSNDPGRIIDSSDTSKTLSDIEQYLNSIHKGDNPNITARAIKSLLDKYNVSNNIQENVVGALNYLNIILNPEEFKSFVRKYLPKILENPSQVTLSLLLKAKENIRENTGNKMRGKLKEQ